MQDALFIINPVAGRGAYKNGLGEALHTLYKNGIRPTIAFTRGVGEASDLAEEGGKKYGLICCVGGDGTLSEVVSGLMRLPGERPPVGYIPLGTANDVASTLKLPKGDPIAAARIIARGNTQEWDVGALSNGDFFTYIAAFGAFTDVSYETSQQKKQTWGQLAYLIEGLSRLPRLPHYYARVELDGKVLEGDYIFGSATNSTSVAGLVKLSPERVRLDDGLFEICLVKMPSSVLELNRLATELLRMDYNGKYFEFYQADTVRFIFSEPVPLTRDGESGGDFTEVTMDNRKGAVRIMVP